MGWKTERVQDMASGIVVGGECGSLLHSDNTRPDIRTYARPGLGRVALAPAWGRRMHHPYQNPITPTEEPEPASRQSPRQGKSPTTSLPPISDLPPPHAS
jgi:hypothetical protein